MSTFVSFKNFWVSFLLLFLLARPGHCTELSKEKVIEIANQAARDLGFDLKKMTVEADENNTMWKKEFASIEDAPGHIGKKVKDKKYWAIYFALIESSDPVTGELLIAAGFDVESNLANRRRMYYPGFTMKNLFF